MTRATLALLGLAAAMIAGSLWVGVATATAIVFMALYALHTWKTA
jgi:hypothetical protein